MKKGKLISFVLMQVLDLFLMAAISFMPLPDKIDIQILSLSNNTFVYDHILDIAKYCLL
jgi:hypothetical protein